MPAYTITNTNGSPVATIGVATTTGATFPIELIGQGISLYGPIVAQNEYRLLENFAKSTPPRNPVTGQFWYDRANKIPNYYDGLNFIPLRSAATSFSSQFHMLAGATNIDFTVGGPINIFTAAGGPVYCPTGLLLLPNGTINTTTPPTFNLYINTQEDVMDNVVITRNVNGKRQFFPINGATKFAQGTDTIKLRIVTPATGGTCHYDAFLFGFTKF